MTINAKRLKITAESKGIKQIDISKVTGLSYSTVNQIWHGRACSADTAAKIAEALGVPLEKLEDRRRRG